MPERDAVLGIDLGMGNAGQVIEWACREMLGHPWSRVRVAWRSWPSCPRSRPARPRRECLQADYYTPRSGDARGLPRLVRALAAPRGRILFFGGPAQSQPMVELDTNAVHYEELIVAGTTAVEKVRDASALKVVVKP